MNIITSLIIFILLLLILQFHIGGIETVIGTLLGSLVGPLMVFIWVYFKK